MCVNVCTVCLSREGGLSTILSTHLIFRAFAPVDGGRNTAALNRNEVEHGLTGPSHCSNGLGFECWVVFHIFSCLMSALEDIIDCLILRHMDPKKCDVCG